MKKKEFLDALSRGLSPLPKRERDERVNFYREMIDDRIEEGIPEEEAVKKHFCHFFCMANVSLFVRIEMFWTNIKRACLCLAKE